MRWAPWVSEQVMWSLVSEETRMYWIDWQPKDWRCIWGQCANCRINAGTLWQWQTVQWCQVTVEGTKKWCLIEKVRQCNQENRYCLWSDEEVIMRSDAENGCKIEEFEHRLKMLPMGTYFVPLIQRKQSMSIINMIPRYPWGHMLENSDWELIEWPKALGGQKMQSWLSEIIKDMWLDLIIVEKTRRYESRSTSPKVQVFNLRLEYAGKYCYMLLRELWLAFGVIKSLNSVPLYLEILQLVTGRRYKGEHIS